MVIALVQPTNPHATRYTLAEREAAYALWCTGAGRSLRKLANLTGISHGTLGNWSKDDGWQERARNEDAAEAKSLRATLATLIAGQVVASVETVVALRDDATGKVPPKVRLDAATWLAGVGGLSPVTKVQDLTSPAADPDDEDLTADAIANMTPDQRDQLRDRLLKRRPG